MLAFSGWYGKRQTRLERQYQARDRVAEKITAENNPAAPSEQMNWKPGVRSRRRATISSPLWPLAVLLGIVAVVAAAMLYRASRARPRLARSTAVESP